MIDFIPLWTVGEAVYFRYTPHGYLNPATGEIFNQTSQIPATILAIAHNFNHEVEIAPGIYMDRTLRTSPVGFFYCVEIDLEEAALLGLDLRYPHPPTASGEAAPLTAEVVIEKQIVSGRIAF